MASKNLRSCMISLCSNCPSGNWDSCKLQMVEPKDFQRKKINSYVSNTSSRLYILLSIRQAISVYKLVPHNTSRIIQFCYNGWGKKWTAHKARSDGLKLINIKRHKKEAPIDIECIFNCGPIVTTCLLN